MRNKISAILLLLGLLLIFVLAYLYFSQNKPAQTGVTISPTVSINRPTGQITKTIGCQAQGALPDKACTPGAVLPSATKEQVCTPGYSKTVRNVSIEEKKAVYAEYGITSHSPGEYEVDHFISLELGGSNL